MSSVSIAPRTCQYGRRAVMCTPQLVATEGRREIVTISMEQI
jgi:hypothetical protein